MVNMVLVKLQMRRGSEIVNGRHSKFVSFGFESKSHSLHLQRFWMAFCFTELLLSVCECASLFPSLMRMCQMQSMNTTHEVVAIWLKIWKIKHVFLCFSTSNNVRCAGCMHTSFSFTSSVRFAMPNCFLMIMWRSRRQNIRDHTTQLRQLGGDRGEWIAIARRKLKWLTNTTWIKML